MHSERGEEGGEEEVGEGGEAQGEGKAEKSMGIGKKEGEGGKLGKRKALWRETRKSKKRGNTI